MRVKIKVIVLFLLALLCACGPFSSARELQANEENNQEQLEQLLLEQEALNSELAKAEAALASFNDEKGLVSSQYAWLMERSAEQQELYKSHLQQNNGILLMMQALDKNLEVALRSYESKKEQYAERICAMFGLQDKSSLELLLEAESLDGYFSTVKLMKLIVEADEAALLELRAARDELLLKKEETSKQLEDLRQIMELIQSELSAIENDLDYYQNANGNLDANLSAQLAQIAAFQTQQVALRQSIEDTELQIEAEAKAEAASPEEEQAVAAAAAPQGTGDGTLTWPIPGNQDISSGFGSRNIPEIGLNDFHTGTDFAADAGVPVYAAATGTVSLASFIEYGGNTVKIKVSSNMEIMYCHLNDFAVSAGESVTVGQLVGYVGSTGLSTGPHLHFEVQVDGVAVDPMQFIR